MSLINNIVYMNFETTKIEDFDISRYTPFTFDMAFTEESIKYLSIKSLIIDNKLFYIFKNKFDDNYTLINITYPSFGHCEVIVSESMTEELLTDLIISIWNKKTKCY